VVKERQTPAHATAIRLAREVFEAAFGPGWDVRTRSPITLDEEPEPEPDIAVVPSRPRDYIAAHPSCPPLALTAVWPRIRAETEAYCYCSSC
jgi:hypothetical protein